jgi:hypothetical protein
MVFETASRPLTSLPGPFAPTSYRPVSIKGKSNDSRFEECFGRVLSRKSESGCLPIRTIQYRSRCYAETSFLASSERRGGRESSKAEGGRSKTEGARYRLIALTLDNPLVLQWPVAGLLKTGTLRPRAKTSGAPVSWLHLLWMQTLPSQRTYVAGEQNGPWSNVTGPGRTRARRLGEQVPDQTPPRRIPLIAQGNRRRCRSVALQKRDSFLFRIQYSVDISYSGALTLPRCPFIITLYSGNLSLPPLIRSRLACSARKSDSRDVRAEPICHLGG